MKKAAPLLISFAVLASGASPGAWFPASGDPAVQQAHEAYLAGDFTRAAISIKKALISHPGDSAVQGNMLALLDKTIEARGARGLPVDWTLPAGVKSLRVAVRRKYNPFKDQVQFGVYLAGELQDSGLVEQLQLIRYPGDVLLDKKAGKGEWDDERWPGGTPAFYFGAEYAAAPPKDGLYLLNVKVRGREGVQGWFIMSRMVASESPAVGTPGFGERYATGNPEFHWSDFKSPEYRPFERRMLHVKVFNEKSRTGESIWDLVTPSPAMQGVSVGACADCQGASRLDSGNYGFQLIYQERWRFGDLMLSRESATGVPFIVAD